MPVLTWPSTWLVTMRNSDSPVGARSRTEMASMRDIGGASVRRRSEEFFELRLGSFDLDGHAVGVVADEAGELGLVREAEHKWAKPDALHHSAHQHGLPFSLLRFGFGGVFGQMESSCSQCRISLEHEAEVHQFSRDVAASR